MIPYAYVNHLIHPHLLNLLDIDMRPKKEYEGHYTKEAGTSFPVLLEDRLISVQARIALAMIVLKSAPLFAESVRYTSFVHLVHILMRYIISPVKSSRFKLFFLTVENYTPRM